MALSFSCSAPLHPKRLVKVKPRNCNSLQNIKFLVESTGVLSSTTRPQESLQNGNWVKLICGASFEDVIDVRNLSLVYTLAGVDCIDCAAEAAVINAVNEGIEAAREIVPLRKPWVMISVNDDEDLHFRKAEFDVEDCPLDCSRPCEAVCPADAILLDGGKSKELFSHNTNMHQQVKGGVITERCYGCGRCIPVCPYDKIKAVSYVRDVTTTSELLKREDVDAMEIHTSGKKLDSFEELWSGLGDSVNYLRLVAVSLPNIGTFTTTSMNTMFSIMQSKLQCYNLWQLDGRPMSGDIGRGATKEAIAFAVQLATAKDRPPGFLQLAGGTNAHTADRLKQQGLIKTSVTKASDGDMVNQMFSASNSLIGGVAYGGYARKIVGRILISMQSKLGLAFIENHPEYLREALKEAIGLVGTIKCYNI